jgi:lipopolysaccharide biosynthesis protein
MLENAQKSEFLVRAGIEYVRQLDESKRGYRHPWYYSEKRPDFDTTNSNVKLLAYYLPQFHPIKENDEWWGRGFTEWTNVARARAHFVGHYQPHLPTDLGYYDLRNEKTIMDQIDLAKGYGISGFIFYYYWFNSRRILETPLNIFMGRKDNDFPFALCWANENWTRRWDGDDREVLLRQTYSRESSKAIIEDIAGALTDSRYIHVDGRPMFCVYRVAQIPDIQETVACWRAAARAVIGKDLFLVSALTFGDLRDPRSYGFDAAMQFPPHGVSLALTAQRIESFKDDYKLGVTAGVHDYGPLAAEARDFLRQRSFPIIPSVFPCWDNTPRKGDRATVFIGSSPDAYSSWLAEAASYASRKPVFDRSFVMINAWNEWAEGAHLEPDQRFGHGFLRATADILRPFVKDTRAAFRSTSFEPTAMIDGLDKSMHGNLAIVIHAYYSDQIRGILKNIPERYYKDTFVTVDDEVDQTMLAQISECTCDINILFFPNRGRDVRPFLGALKAIRTRGYKYFLKVHTKKSIHRADGFNWGAELTQPLLSALQSDSIESFLESEPNVGLIGSAGHIVSGLDYIGSSANMQWIEKLSEHLGIQFNKDDFSFVAGTMFAGRVSVFDQLTDDPWLPSMFEEELGRLDGTLAHAMERMFGLICMAANKEIASVSIVDGHARFGQSPPDTRTYKYAAPQPWEEPL